MTDSLWDFDKISEERIQFLKTPFEFGALISRIQTEAQNVRYKKDKGTHEAKEAWRPMFCFDVSEKTFDCFFNSPYGYRGQFLVDPEEGKRKNVQLVSALIDTLVGAGCCPNELLSQIQQSLASPHAKIWIDEGQHNPSTPDLIVQIRVPEWEAAAREVSKRLGRHDPTITHKEIDRIYGV